MKTAVIITASLAIIAVLSPLAEARGSRGSVSGTGSNPRSSYHRGYTPRGGGYRQPHYQTNPNRTRTDNYGASGNYNPHTGKTSR